MDIGSISPNLAEIIHSYQDDFMVEIRNILDEIDMSLINIEAEPHNKMVLVEVFQHFHTISGLSALLQDNLCFRISKTSEDLIETTRKYRSITEPYIINDLVQCSKFVRQLAEKPVLAEDSKLIGEIGQHLSGMKQTQNDIIMMVRQPIEKEVRIGEILIYEGTMVKSDVDEVLYKQRNQTTNMKFGEILLKEKRVNASDVIHAIRMQRIRNAVPEVSSVYVQLHQVDQFIHLLQGIQNQCDSVHQEAQLRFGNVDKFTADTEKLSHQLVALQQILTAVCRVSLAETFVKLQQTIGSLLEEKRKPIRMSTTGDYTEIDKDVSDAIIQPMTDMITVLVDNATETDDEKRLCNIELLAYIEDGKPHIDIQGDSLIKLDYIKQQVRYQLATDCIARMGGKVLMDNMSGKGTRIRLYLPSRGEVL